MQATLGPGALLTEVTAVAATLGSALLADGTAVDAMLDGGLEGTGASDDVAALGVHAANTRVRTTRRSFVKTTPFVAGEPSAPTRRNANFAQPTLAAQPIKSRSLDRARTGRATAGLVTARPTGDEPGRM